MRLHAEELATAAARLADEKKANDITVLDIRGLSVIADYFVICSGNSETQVEAILDSLVKGMREMDVEIRRIEGAREARWVLVDIGDVVVHIFHQEEREFYQLERLWADAKTVDWQVALT